MPHTRLRLDGIQGSVAGRGAATPGMGGKTLDRSGHDEWHSGFDPTNGQKQTRCRRSEKSAGMRDGLAERTIRRVVLGGDALVERCLRRSLDDAGRGNVAERSVNMRLSNDGLQRERQQQNPRDRAKARSLDAGAPRFNNSHWAAVPCVSRWSNAPLVWHTPGAIQIASDPFPGYGQAAPPGEFQLRSQVNEDCGSQVRATAGGAQMTIAPKNVLLTMA